MEPIKFTLAIAKRIKDEKIKMDDGSNFDLFGDPSHYIPLLFDDGVLVAQVWKAIQDDKRPIEEYLATLDGQDLSPHAQAILDGLPSFLSLPHLKRAMASLYREGIQKVMAEQEKTARILFGLEFTVESPSADTTQTSGS